MLGGLQSVWRERTLNVLGPEPQFRHGIKTTRTGRRRGLESEDFVPGMLLTPTGRQFVQFRPLPAHTL